MEKEILNLQEASGFLQVGERTLLKLLREEHIPGRKIGREWRFSREALLTWLSEGDSIEYINKDEVFEVCKDESGNYDALIEKIIEFADDIKENRNINNLLEDIPLTLNIPDNVTLRVSYKQKRDLEKLAFKLYWPLSEERKVMSK
ncbi:MAG: helix-turn-helix domain-containing protein [Clostridium sp.]|nr:helix-turn-helix domain-containing protein [Clostridium sp.]